MATEHATQACERATTFGRRFETASLVSWAATYKHDYTDAGIGSEVLIPS